MIRCRVIASLALALLCAGRLAAPAAEAFVVEGPAVATGDPVEDLRQAPRWARTDSALTQTGERGLGGGLEYAVDDSVCRINFVDGATCDEARAAIREALARWSDGHPSIVFTDVTGQVAPAFPLAVLGETDQGAEIDFFGATPAQFPNFRSGLTNGYTIFYTRKSPGVLMTNGVYNASSEGAMESVDVRFNLARCYYLDPDFTLLDNQTCVHFPTLAFHEIGHALGLGHPEESPGRNLDLDDDPYNPMPINCRDPAKGLKPSRNLQGGAVLVGRDVQNAGRWERGLTDDDIAARDALYPDCGIVAKPRFSRH